MRTWWIGGAAAAVVLVLSAGPLAAQQRQQSAPGQPALTDDDEPDVPAPPPPKAPKRSRGQGAAPVLQPDPDLDAADQLAPSQIQQQMPSAVAAPSSGGTRRAAAHPAAATAAPDAGEAPPAPSAAKVSAPVVVRGPLFKTVACGNGPFSKDSSSLKLASIFDSRNITFTEIDVSGVQVGATIVYPKDPKKRLEVWWTNPGQRSDIYLMVIGGQSLWGAPGGVRLGLTLVELERLNKKPFKLKGFNSDKIAEISDWNGGALATLPGGCKNGVNLKADAKVSANALSALSEDKEYSSDDPAIRAAKPTVSEILIGY